jgi:hypothetical protein
MLSTDWVLVKFLLTIFATTILLLHMPTVSLLGLFIFGATHRAGAAATLSIRLSAVYIIRLDTVGNNR